MDIQLEKIALIKKIADTEDVSIIAAIKDFFKTEKKDFWEELSEEQKLEINYSLREFDNEKYSKFDDFVAPYI